MRLLIDIDHCWWTKASISLWFFVKALICTKVWGRMFSPKLVLTGVSPPCFGFALPTLNSYSSWNIKFSITKILQILWTGTRFWSLESTILYNESKDNILALVGNTNKATSTKCPESQYHNSLHYKLLSPSSTLFQHVHELELFVKSWDPKSKTLGFFEIKDNNQNSVWDNAKWTLHEKTQIFSFIEDD